MVLPSTGVTPFMQRLLQRNAVKVFRCRGVKRWVVDFVMSCCRNSAITEFTASSKLHHVIAKSFFRLRNRQRQPFAEDKFYRHPYAAYLFYCPESL